MLRIKSVFPFIMLALASIQFGCQLPSLNPSEDPSSSPSPTPYGFQTKDSFKFGNSDSSIPSSIAVDSGGAIYVAGLGSASGTPRHWVVRKSVDGGNNWATIDDYQYPAGGAWARAIAIAPNGDIYVGGEASDSSSHLHGIIRKSSNQGVTWSTVDSFAYTPRIASSRFGVTSIAIDSSGNIFAAGSDGGWIVRKSSNAGASWSTVDSYSYAFGGPYPYSSASYSGYAAAAHAIAVDLSGNIYAAGYGAEMSSVYPYFIWRWIVRKSSDHGSTWTVVDTYFQSSNHFAIANALVTDVAGNVYAAGFQGTHSNGTYYPPSKWIIRKGISAGTNWSTVHTSATARTGDFVNALAVDSSGNLYSAGSLGGYWTVKASPDEGASWTDVDKTWGSAACIATLNETLITGGQATQNTDPIHWTVRVWNQ